MYKLITISTLLLGLALTPFVGGNIVQEQQKPAQNSSPHAADQDTDQVGEQTKSSAVGVESGSCEWACEPCEPDQGCSQTCTEIGNCGSTCNMIARCDAGYVWDEASCSCIR